MAVFLPTVVLVASYPICDDVEQILARERTSTNKGPERARLGAWPNLVKFSDDFADLLQGPLVVSHHPMQLFWKLQHSVFCKWLGELAGAVVACEGSDVFVDLLVRCVGLVLDESFDFRFDDFLESI